MTLEGAKFICLDEAGNHGEIVLAKGRKFTMGYYVSCDFVLVDERAKGVHCEIDCDAFGRVTIRNLSPDKPILVNGSTVEIKRILLNNSKLSILDKEYLWLFPKISSNEFEDLPVEAASTPQKQIGIPEQPPNSCPDFKLHREIPKRFTVHNFAYCIQSDEEGNNSSDSNDENTNEQDTQTNQIQNELETQTKCDKTTDPKTNITQEKDTANRNRSVTPEPKDQNEKSTGAVMETPKMNLINRTKDKENKSTQKKNKQLLTMCNQSDVVITSFSPRETGVRIEKSFATIVKPKVLVTKTPATPKSVYSTPKSDINEKEQEDDPEDDKEIMTFHTPSTSKKGTASTTSMSTACSKVLKNSSMHLIDLTTPNKLRPASPYLKSALKASAKKNITQTTAIDKSCSKLSAEERLGLSALPSTPVLTDASTSALETPCSVISVSSSTDTSSIIEVTSDGSNIGITPGSSTGLNTPAKPQNRTGACTPKRTPHSLMKRALLTSAKKQNTTPQKNANTATTPRRESINRIPLRSNLALLRTPVTPQASTGDNSTSQLPRRLSLSTPTRKSMPARSRFDMSPSTSNLASSPSTSNKMATRRSSINPISAARALPTSTPVSASSNNSGLRTRAACKTSPLHKVRKSIGGVPLSSHISKTRRSIVLPASTSKITSIKEKSPQQVMSNRLVTRARKSLCLTPISDRSRNMATAAKTPSQQSGPSSILKAKTTQSARKLERKAVLFADKHPTADGEVDDLSRTFIVDSDEEENADQQEEKPKDATFSPEKEPQKLTEKVDKKEAKKEQESIEIPVDVEEITSLIKVNKEPKHEEAIKTSNEEKIATAEEKNNIEGEVAVTEIEVEDVENNVPLPVCDKSKSIVTEESFAEIINDSQETNEEHIEENRLIDTIEITDSPTEYSPTESQESFADALEEIVEENIKEVEKNIIDPTENPVEVITQVKNEKTDVLETGFGEESIVEIIETSNTENTEETTSDTVIDTPELKNQSATENKTEEQKNSQEMENESSVNEVVECESITEETKSLDVLELEDKVELKVDDQKSYEYKPIVEDITLEGSLLEKETKENEDTNVSKQPLYEDITLEASLIDEKLKSEEIKDEITKESEISKILQTAENSEEQHENIPTAEEISNISQEPESSTVQATKNVEDAISDENVLELSETNKVNEETLEENLEENSDSSEIIESEVQSSTIFNEEIDDDNTNKLLEEIEDVLNKSDEIKQKHLIELEEGKQESEKPLTEEFESEKLTQEIMENEEETKENISSDDKVQEISDLETSQQDVKCLDQEGLNDNECEEVTETLSQEESSKSTETLHVETENITLTDEMPEFSIEKDSETTTLENEIVLQSEENVECKEQDTQSSESNTTQPENNTLEEEKAESCAQENSEVKENEIGVSNVEQDTKTETEVVVQNVDAAEEMEEISSNLSDDVTFSENIDSEHADSTPNESKTEIGTQESSDESKTIVLNEENVKEVQAKESEIDKNEKNAEGAIALNQNQDTQSAETNVSKTEDKTSNGEKIELCSLEKSEAIVTEIVVQNEENAEELEHKETKLIKIEENSDDLEAKESENTQNEENPDELKANEFEIIQNEKNSDELEAIESDVTQNEENDKDLDVLIQSHKQDTKSSEHIVLQTEDANTELSILEECETETAVQKQENAETLKDTASIQSVESKSFENIVSQSEDNTLNQEKSEEKEIEIVQNEQNVQEQSAVLENSSQEIVEEQSVFCEASCQDKDAKSSDETVNATVSQSAANSAKKETEIVEEQSAVTEVLIQDPDPKSSNKTVNDNVTQSDTDTEQKVPETVSNLQQAVESEEIISKMEKSKELLTSSIKKKIENASSITPRRTRRNSQSAETPQTTATTELSFTPRRSTRRASQSNETPEISSTELSFTPRRSARRASMSAETTSTATPTKRTTRRASLSVVSETPVTPKAINKRRASMSKDDETAKPSTSKTPRKQLEQRMVIPEEIEEVADAVIIEKEEEQAEEVVQSKEKKNEKKRRTSISGDNVTPKPNTTKTPRAKTPLKQLEQSVVQAEQMEVISVIIEEEEEPTVEILENDKRKNEKERLIKDPKDTIESKAENKEPTEETSTTDVINLDQKQPVAVEALETQDTEKIILDSEEKPETTENNTTANSDDILSPDEKDVADVAETLEKKVILVSEQKPAKSDDILSSDEKEVVAVENLEKEVILVSEQKPAKSDDILPSDENEVAAVETLEKKLTLVSEQKTDDTEVSKKDIATTKDVIVLEEQQNAVQKFEKEVATEEISENAVVDTADISSEENEGVSLIATDVIIDTHEKSEDTMEELIDSSNREDEVDKVAVKEDISTMAENSEGQDNNAKSSETNKEDDPSETSKETDLNSSKRSADDNIEEEMENLQFEDDAEKTPPKVTAGISTDIEEEQLSTPIQKKSVKIVAPSPKTPLMAGMRELLKTPKAEIQTPRLGGIRDLVRTPKEKPECEEDEIENLAVVADLVMTPKIAKETMEMSTPKAKKQVTIVADSPKTPSMTGMRELLKTPKCEMNTPKLVGIRNLVRTPKAKIENEQEESEKLAVVAELVKTPQNTKVAEEMPSTSVKHDNLKGVKELLRTPKSCSTPRFKGMRELMQTPKASSTPVMGGVKQLLESPVPQDNLTELIVENTEIVEKPATEEVPATSSKNVVSLKGVKNLSKAPKGCSTPRLKGIRELMQTPKKSSTPIMGGIKELMDSPAQQKDQELEKFLRTPTAKNIMIPSMPSSAVIEKSCDSIEISTEYDLNASHEGGETANLEELFKTPVASRFVERITASYYVEEGEEHDETVEKFNKNESLQDTLNKSAEEAFDKLVGQESQIQTPINKTYKRTSFALHTSQVQSPFTAADVLSDLPKSDVQEWLETLDQAEPPTILECEDDNDDLVEQDIVNESVKENEEVSVLEYSLSEQNISADDSIIPETCTKVYLSENSLTNVATASLSNTSTKDPLLSATSKPKEIVTRPLTPIEAEISGINLLDQTVESVQDEPSMLDEPLLVEEPSMFEEHLVVSDNESEADGTLNNEANDLSEPLMFSDSEDLNQSRESETNELEVKHDKNEVLHTSNIEVNVQEKSMLAKVSDQSLAEDPLETNGKEQKASTIEDKPMIDIEASKIEDDSNGDESSKDDELSADTNETNENLAEYESLLIEDSPIKESLSSDSKNASDNIKPGTSKIMVQAKAKNDETDTLKHSDKELDAEIDAAETNVVEEKQISEINTENSEAKEISIKETKVTSNNSEDIFLDTSVTEIFEETNEDQLESKEMIETEKQSPKESNKDIDHECQDIFMDNSNIDESFADEATNEENDVENESAMVEVTTKEVTKNHSEDVSSTVEATNDSITKCKTEIHTSDIEATKDEKTVKENEEVVEKETDNHSEIIGKPKEEKTENGIVIEESTDDLQHVEEIESLELITSLTADMADEQSSSVSEELESSHIENTVEEQTELTELQTQIEAKLNETSVINSESSDEKQDKETSNIANEQSSLLSEELESSQIEKQSEMTDVPTLIENKQSDTSVTPLESSDEKQAEVTAELESSQIEDIAEDQTELTAIETKPSEISVKQPKSSAEKEVATKLSETSVIEQESSDEKTIKTLEIMQESSDDKQTSDETAEQRADNKLSENTEEQIIQDAEIFTESSMEQEEELKPSSAATPSEVIEKETKENANPNSASTVESLTEDKLTSEVSQSAVEMVKEAELIPECESQENETSAVEREEITESSTEQEEECKPSAATPSEVIEKETKENIYQDSSSTVESSTEEKVTSEVSQSAVEMVNKAESIPECESSEIENSEAEKEETNEETTSQTHEESSNEESSEVITDNSDPNATEHVEPSVNDDLTIKTTSQTLEEPSAVEMVNEADSIPECESQEIETSEVEKEETIEETTSQTLEELSNELKDAVSSEVITDNSEPNPTEHVEPSVNDDLTIETTSQTLEESSAVEMVNEADSIPECESQEIETSEVEKEETIEETPSQTLEELSNELKDSVSSEVITDNSEPNATEHVELSVNDDLTIETTSQTLEESSAVEMVNEADSIPECESQEIETSEVEKAETIEVTPSQTLEELSNQFKDSVSSEVITDNSEPNATEHVEPSVNDDLTIETTSQTLEESSAVEMVNEADSIAECESQKIETSEVDKEETVEEITSQTLEESYNELQDSVSSEVIADNSETNATEHVEQSVKAIEKDQIGSEKSSETALIDYSVSKQETSQSSEESFQTITEIEENKSQKSKESSKTISKRAEISEGEEKSNIDNIILVSKSAEISEDKESSTIKEETKTDESETIEEEKSNVDKIITLSSIAEEKDLLKSVKEVSSTKEEAKQTKEVSTKVMEKSDICEEKSDSISTPQEISITEKPKCTSEITESSEVSTKPSEIIKSYDFEIKINDTDHHNQKETAMETIEKPATSLRKRKCSHTEDTSNATTELPTTRRARRNTKMEEHSTEITAQTEKDSQELTNIQETENVPSYVVEKQDLEKPELTAVKSNETVNAAVKEVFEVSEDSEVKEHQVSSIKTSRKKRTMSESSQDSTQGEESHSRSRRNKRNVIKKAAEEKLAEVKEEIVEQQQISKHDVVNEDVKLKRKRTTSESSQGSLKDDNHHSSTRRGRRKVQKTPVEETVIEQMEGFTQSEEQMVVTEIPAIIHNDVEKERAEELIVEGDEEIVILSTQNMEPVTEVTVTEEKLNSELPKETNAETHIKEEIEELSTEKTEHDKTKEESKTDAVKVDKSNVREESAAITPEADIVAEQKAEDVQSEKHEQVTRIEKATTSALAVQQNSDIPNENVTDTREESAAITPEADIVAEQKAEDVQSENHEQVTRIEKATTSALAVQQNSDIPNENVTDTRIEEIQATSPTKHQSEEPTSNIPKETVKENKHHAQNRSRRKPTVSESSQGSVHADDSSILTTKLQEAQTDEISVEEVITSEAPDLHKDDIEVKSKLSDIIEFPESEEVETELLQESVPEVEEIVAITVEEPKEQPVKRGRRKPTVSESSQGSVHEDDNTRSRKTRRKLQKAPVEEVVVEERMDKEEITTTATSSKTEQILTTENKKDMETKERDFESTLSVAIQQEEPGTDSKLAEEQAVEVQSVTLEEVKEQTTKRGRRKPTVSESSQGSVNEDDFTRTRRGRRKVQKTSVEEIVLEESEEQLTNQLEMPVEIDGEKEEVPAKSTDLNQETEENLNKNSENMIKYAVIDLQEDDSTKSNQEIALDEVALESAQVENHDQTSESKDTKEHPQELPEVVVVEKEKTQGPSKETHVEHEDTKQHGTRKLDLTENVPEEPTTSRKGRRKVQVSATEVTPMESISEHKNLPVEAEVISSETKSADVKDIKLIVAENEDKQNEIANLPELLSKEIAEEKQETIDNLPEVISIQEKHNEETNEESLKQQEHQQNDTSSKQTAKRGGRRKADVEEVPAETSTNVKDTIPVVEITTSHTKRGGRHKAEASETTTAEVSKGRSASRNRQTPAEHPTTSETELIEVNEKQIEKVEEISTAEEIPAPAEVPKGRTASRSRKTPVEHPTTSTQQEEQIESTKVVEDIPIVAEVSKVRTASRNRKTPEEHPTTSTHQEESVESIKVVEEIPTVAEVPKGRTASRNRKTPVEHQKSSTTHQEDQTESIKVVEEIATVPVVPKGRKASRNRKTPIEQTTTTQQELPVDKEKQIESSEVIVEIPSEIEKRETADVVILDDSTDEELPAENEHKKEVEDKSSKKRVKRTRTASETNQGSVVDEKPTKRRARHQVAETGEARVADVKTKYVETTELKKEEHIEEVQTNKEVADKPQKSTRRRGAAATHEDHDEEHLEQTSTKFRKRRAIHKECEEHPHAKNVEEPKKPSEGEQLPEVQITEVNLEPEELLDQHITPDEENQKDVKVRKGRRKAAGEEHHQEEHETLAATKRRAVAKHIEDDHEESGTSSKRRVGRRHQAAEDHETEGEVPAAHTESSDTVSKRRNMGKRQHEKEEDHHDVTASEEQEENETLAATKRRAVAKHIEDDHEESGTSSKIRMGRRHQAAEEHETEGEVPAAHTESSETVSKLRNIGKRQHVQEKEDDHHDVTASEVPTHIENTETTCTRRNVDRKKHDHESEHHDIETQHPQEEAKKGKGRTKKNNHSEESEQPTKAHSPDTKHRGRKRKESQTDTQEHDSNEKEHTQDETLTKEPEEKLVNPSSELQTPQRAVPVARKGRKASTIEHITAESQELDDTPGRRARNVPQRRAATAYHNYDETSDSDVVTKAKKKTDSPRKSLEASKSSPTATITSAAIINPSPSPSSTASATTARGRTRKPTAKVQQFLEEERAKAETPKKKGLLAAAAVNDASTPQRTPARRGRKASTIDTEVEGTPQVSKGRGRGKHAIAHTKEDHSVVVPETTSVVEVKEIELHTTPPPAQSAKGRRGGRKAKITEEEQHKSDEPPAKKSPLELESEKQDSSPSADAPTPPTRVAGRRNAAAAAKARIEEDALAAAAVDPPKRARAKKVPAKVATSVVASTDTDAHSSEVEEEKGGKNKNSPQKRDHRLASASTIEGAEDLEDDIETETMDKPANKKVRKAATATTTDSTAAVPAKRSRKAKAVEEEADTETPGESKTTRGRGRGRKNVQFNEHEEAVATTSTQKNTANIEPAAVETPEPVKRGTRTRRK